MNKEKITKTSTKVNSALLNAQFVFVKRKKVVEKIITFKKPLIEY